MKGAIRTSGRRSFRGGKHAILDPELMSLMSFVESMRYADVEPLARRILARRPDQPLALKALSFAQLGLGRYEDAVILLDHAIPRNPGDAELHNNRGIALTLLMRWEDSMTSFRRARELTPDDPELLKNIGGALYRMHHWNEAVPILLEAIEKHPGDYVEAIQLLADCLSNGGRVDEAWTCFRELYESNPLNSHALCQLIATSLKRCYWDHLPSWLEMLREKTRNFEASLPAPFSVLAFPGLSGLDHRHVAEQHAKLVLPAVGKDAQPVSFVPAVAGERLRIAYLSGDFRSHPVGYIIPEIIERHDRSLVSVHGYSTTADDGSEIHSRLRAAFDQFDDVTNFPVAELAKRIRNDRIDVLVDLNGWTAEGRPEALALRCAPIQVNWLGYAGTMGDARLADFVLGDPVVTPNDEAGLFSEKIVQLPNCYLPADTTRPIGDRPARGHAGLPESAFVYSSFNNSYKFNPEIADLWCAILRATPGSVLWLGSTGESAKENLRKEIEARGIAGARLIFAPRVDDRAAHLNRMQLADLALDPFPYNSHSTGVDTLWAGVPMVTLRGGTFASRVGASLLAAAGLSELITATGDDYARLAIDLYAAPERLASYRERLVQARTTAPLFDMARFARDLEGIFFGMAGRPIVRGETPAATSVDVAGPAAPGRESCTGL